MHRYVEQADYVVAIPSRYNGIILAKFNFLGNNASIFLLQATPSNDQPSDCREGFYFDLNETNSCRPECGEFMYSSLVSVIFSRLSYTLGLFASAAMLILALTLQKKILYVTSVNVIPSPKYFAP